MTRLSLLAAVAAGALLPTVAAAQTMPGMPGIAMPEHPAPAPAPSSTPTAAMPDAAAPADPMMAAMPGMAGMMAGGGDYAGGSGTSRLPAAEGAMHGLHLTAGGFALMAHGYLWGVATDQGGPRGEHETFVESMAMVEASRDLAPAVHLQLRTMLSLEPLMGAKGYPNLFATGELAGERPLVDRQHPHDLFMELSGRIDVDVARGTTLFVYGGPVAEPALGPSAFMHRGSAQYLPLSPITHHWFDSTHITYGVVTLGVAARHFQIEGSGFRGREPDEHRWDIETPAIDSWSLRATWTPSPHWAVQLSHGRLRSPEEEHPDEDEVRTTASLHYAAGGLATTLAFSAKNRVPGRTLTAWLAEANWDVTRHHSLFGRIENVANDELFPDADDPLHDRPFRVTRFEGGYAYRMALAGPLSLAIGATVAAYAKPAALDAAYGRHPVSGTVFAKLSLGR